MTSVEVDSDDDYDNNLKLMQLDSSLRMSHINVQQMERGNSSWLRVNVARMNPLSIIQIIDEPTMIKMFGRDRFLYLKFLKYQSWFFLSIFFLGWTILLPTYNSGSDAGNFIQTVVENVEEQAEDKATAELG